MVIKKQKYPLHIFESHGIVNVAFDNVVHNVVAVIFQFGDENDDMSVLNDPFSQVGDIECPFKILGLTCACCNVFACVVVG